MSMQTLQQIFKKIPDFEYIEYIIQSICFLERKTSKYRKYCINEEIFKSYIFNNDINDTLEDLDDFYHASKNKYLDSLGTYKGFITILRHLCKTSEKISYDKKIKYQFNNYKIEYIIYIYN